MRTSLQPGAAGASATELSRPGDAQPTNPTSNPTTDSHHGPRRGRANRHAAWIRPGPALDSRDDILFWLCATGTQPRTSRSTRHPANSTAFTSPFRVPA